MSKTVEAVRKLNNCASELNIASLIPPITIARFSELFNLGYDALNLELRDVAALFGCSRPIVKRWKDGSSAPAPAMRKLVIDKLKELAFAEINEIISELDR